jgi:hypothetical protein
MSAFGGQADIARTCRNDPKRPSGGLAPSPIQHASLSQYVGQHLAKKLFFVSDLHMGGDGRLQHCDYTTEFVGFLKELEGEGADTELLIVGDTFGFWDTKLFSISSSSPGLV